MTETVELSDNREESDKDYTTFDEVKDEKFCVCDPSLILKFLIFSAYFTDGTDLLRSLAVRYYAKDVLRLDPAQTQFIQSTGTWPWIPKFLYGFLTDSVPIFHHRRKPYLLLFCSLSSLCMITFACYDLDSVSFTVVLILYHLGCSFVDVVIDGLVVENSKGRSKQTASNYQTLCVVAISIGVIVTGFSGGYIIQSIGPQFTFLILSLLPLVSMIITVFTVEEQSPISITCTTFKEQLRKLGHALIEPKVVKSVGLVAFLYLMPTLDAGVFYYTTNVLKIEAIFLGYVNGVSGIASLIAAILYNFLLVNTKFKHVMIISILFLSIFGMCPLVLYYRWNVSIGISDQVFLISSTVLTSMVNNIMRLTIFVYVARICPGDIESTMFATLMGVLNLASLLSGYIGSGIMKGVGVTETNFDNFWIALIIERVLGLLPLILVPFAPDLDEDKYIKVN